jgi:hypothetical protein
MSSVVISGDTSGAITLAAPAVAGTNTITLPASTGTVITTGSPQSGSILQVVQASYNTSTSFTSSSYASTGIAASITPKFSNSKVLVMICVPLQVSTSGTYGAGFSIYRGGSAVFTDTNGYDEGYSSANPSTGNNSFRWGRGNLQYLDSPATTSNTTYTVYCSAYAGTITTCVGGAIAFITLLEVAA